VPPSKRLDTIVAVEIFMRVGVKVGLVRRKDGCLLVRGTVPNSFLFLGFRLFK